MVVNSESANTQETRPDWYHEISRFAKPNLRKAIWQLLNTFIPYSALWVLMIYTIQKGYSYWITLGLAVVAASLLIRIFIFFHDCCHGSFFASRRANRILGYIAGLLTFTPFEDWRRWHNAHHSSSGDLDRRGAGDVWILTVEEYLAAPFWKRIGYHFTRNPFSLFGVGPAAVFLIEQRFPHKGAGKPEAFSVNFTNLAILATIGVASLTIGFRTFLLIQLPVLLISGAIGLWLFYVQHQFDGVYWARHGEFDPTRAALEGSSYYKLPKVLQWFSGNIGLHHIHHARSGIPNYHLQQCYDEIPALQKDEPLTILRSLKSLMMNLWDEKQQKLVSFWSVKAAPPE